MRKKNFIFIFLFLFLFNGCDQVTSNPEATNEETSPAVITTEFKGTTGDFIEIVGDQIALDESLIKDGNAHFYNTTLPEGDKVYFFIVKSPDGKIRAAANACQVCGDALQGFRQEGEYMVCNTCGNRYPMNKIATEKGGCNPAPINADLKSIDGKIMISLIELQNINKFFK